MNGIQRNFLGLNTADDPSSSGLLFNRKDMAVIAWMVGVPVREGIQVFERAGKMAPFTFSPNSLQILSQKAGPLIHQQTSLRPGQVASILN